MILAIRNILFLPAVLLRDVFKSERSLARKLALFLVVFVLFGLIWYTGIRTSLALANLYLFDLGLIDKITEVQVSGDSMLPTITSGSQVELHNPLKHDIKRGDIVSFQNIETANLHYLKRVVGLPDEEVLIKNGFVIINGKVILEDYILNQLPTYGNTFLVECNTYKIPEDHYLVLGDNRTVSMDSRVIGFVHHDDIDGVIKTNLVDSFSSYQRQRDILKAQIDKNVLAEKINNQRTQKGSSPLVISHLLNEVATNRADSIKTYFDDWRNKAPSIGEMLDEENYQYNSAHEFVTFGYLDEESVVKQILESSRDELAFLSNNYMEVGVGLLEMTNKECTFPVISIIITWPANPTYSQETVDFWENEEVVNKELLNVLQGYVGYSGVDQAELRKLIDDVAEAANVATEIKQSIDSGEWVDYDQTERYHKLVEKIKPRLEEFTR